MITKQELEEMLDNFQMGLLDKEQDKLENLRGKQVLLYGAGNIGKRLIKNFQDVGIKVECFIDRNINIDSSKYSVPVYHPESDNLIKYKQNGYVILSALFPLNLCSEIRQQLINTGFKNIFALHQVNLSTINNGAFYETLFDGTYNKIDITGRDKVKILEVFSWLEDNQDKQLYIDYIKAHLTMDFTRFKKPHDISMQYLAHDIPLEIDYSNFIDCGGFDGDTIRSFVNNGIAMKNIAVFEPQNDLCQKISRYIRENAGKFCSATVFPCGVHSQTEKFRFAVSSDAPSASKIDENGNDIIQCVSIDDVLQGFNPTFIKMDIEGAEVGALKGARDTITTNHPYLAICVYHSLSDIWEIPLLIKSFYNGYRFYLRSYNYMGLETVLYAVPEDKQAGR